MRYLVFLLALAACDASPAWQMTGAPSQRVTVGGHDYTVWRKDGAFEIVRHGYAPRAEQGAVKATMLQVVAQVTGCTPRVESGDSGEMRGRLTACKS